MFEDEAISDEELALRCQQGDMSAFEVLFERYQAPIRAYIYQIVHNYDDAACIAQEAFLKVFEKVNSFDVNRKFSSWFFTVSRNVAIDFLHSRRRKAMVTFSDLDRSEGDNIMEKNASGPSIAVDAGMVQEDSVEQLRIAMEQLPQIFREIIELIIFQGLSYEQASEILGGVSLGTLRSRMFHALKHLRRSLTSIAGENGLDLLE